MCSSLAAAYVGEHDVGADDGRHRGAARQGADGALACTQVTNRVRLSRAARPATVACRGRAARGRSSPACVQAAARSGRHRNDLSTVRRRWCRAARSLQRLDILGGRVFGLDQVCVAVMQQVHQALGLFGDALAANQTSEPCREAAVLLLCPLARRIQHVLRQVYRHLSHGETIRVHL